MIIQILTLPPPLTFLNFTHCNFTYLLLTVNSASSPVFGGRFLFARKTGGCTASWFCVSLYPYLYTGMRKSKFLIAATSSGCGKTTLSLGLMRALTRRHIHVQPFKCGPDYIDTQFHALAAGTPSINLDLFMASESHVRSLFSDYDAEVKIVEGVMGMFDGYSRMKGSSADVAMTLDIPVVLLVNAASTAYSVAATVFGFRNFMPEVKIAGVIFNRVASESHFAFLKEACADAGVECLGYIKRNERLAMPSRHLGLSLAAREEMERYISEAAEAVEEGVDIDRLLELTSGAGTPENIQKPAAFPTARQPLKIAVARDEAFNFIYPANIRSLENHPRYAAEINYFSPLRDTSIPESTDIVYLPGGYPELFASELEANESMRNSIREFAACGGRIIGECGGMIYLGEETDGKKMCGVLPIKSTMKEARLRLGYRSVGINALKFRGHEFHYSKTENDTKATKADAVQTDIRGKAVATPVYRQGNVVAGYTHLYWAEADILKLFNL